MVSGSSCKFDLFDVTVTGKFDIIFAFFVQFSSLQPFKIYVEGLAKVL